jgi:hypothetical protein
VTDLDQGSGLLSTSMAPRPGCDCNALPRRGLLLPAVLNHSGVLDTVLQSLSVVALLRLRAVSREARECVDARVAASGRSVYCLGGDTGDETGSPQVRTMRLGGSGATWQRLSDMGTGRIHPAACCLPNGDLVVAGGSQQISLGHEVFASAEIYDSKRGMWRPMPAMIQARTNAEACCSSEGNVVVLGGYWQNPTDCSRDTFTHNGAQADTANADSETYGTVEFLNSVEQFNVAEQVWEPMPPMQHARGRFGCAALSDGRIVVAGGLSNSGPLPLAEMYIPSARRWIPLPRLMSPRTSCRICPCDGGVMLFGGTEVWSHRPVTGITTTGVSTEADTNHDQQYHEQTMGDKAAVSDAASS